MSLDLSDHRPSATEPPAGPELLPLPTDPLPPAERPPRGRLRTDHELLTAVRHLLPEAGVTRVADLTDLDDVGLPTVSAIRPNGRSLSMSAGKGPTLSAATASAVMEALETHVAETWRPTLVLASAEELDESFAGLARTRIARDPGSPILWCEAVDLVDGSQRHVPFSCVHVDWSLPPAYDDGWFVRDSNGLASGQTRDEALLHALCELVERDATRCHEALPVAEQDERRFEPTGPIIEAVLAQARGEHRLVGLWNLSADVLGGPEPVGVPVVAATILEREADPFRPLPAGGGLGAHPDPEIAAVRAIAEAAQSRLITIAGARDDLDRGAFQRFFDATASDALRTRIRGIPPDGPAPVTARWRDPASLAARVAEVTGWHPIAVDLTPPGWPVHVVRVIAPGLESALNDDALDGERARRAAAVGEGNR